MRVIVCGSRHWTDRARIEDRLHDLALTLESPLDCTIVHGGARGADRIAADEARKAGFIVEPPHLPDYDLYSSKRAPLERNERMAVLGADLCIAFWDGRSTGTLDMLDRAAKYDIPCEVVLR